MGSTTNVTGWMKDDICVCILHIIEEYCCVLEQDFMFRHHWWNGM